MLRFATAEHLGSTPVPPVLYRLCKPRASGGACVRGRHEANPVPRAVSGCAELLISKRKTEGGRPATESPVGGAPGAISRCLRRSQLDREPVGCGSESRRGLRPRRSQLDREPVGCRFESCRRQLRAAPPAPSGPCAAIGAAHTPESIACRASRPDRGFIFKRKERRHACRHRCRPVRPRGRRVRAADGAGVERQENRSARHPGKGTGPAARRSTAAHVNRAVERAEWLP